MGTSKTDPRFEAAALAEAELVGADMAVNPEYRLRRGGDGADGAAS